jgi:asparagine synthase (glutamine-hydrolysing)
MFGICGWIGECAGGAEPRRILEDMLADRGGPSGRNEPMVAETGIHLGCLDPSPAASACLFADEALAVVQSEELKGASGRSISASDLADLYRSHGPDFLHRVRGPFSLAVYDRRRRTLLLAVDRIGQRPLYWHRQRGCVAFSSRLSGLRRLPGFQPELDKQAVFNYLYFHVVPSPGTIYSHCGKLLPAQMCRFDGDGQRSDRFYWTMPYREDNPAGFDSLREEFRSLLPQVVARAAGDGAAVGAFLSGGTDSSTVAGTLTRVWEKPVRTYSMGFQAEGFDEVAYARIAAGHFSTDAREYYVTPQDVLESIPEVAAYCDEPFGNASVVPAYLCARYARGERIDRLLAGDGGDEIFGGNARYANQWVFELYGRIPGALRRALVEPLAAGIPARDPLPPLGKLRSYVDQAKVPLPDRLETYNFLHRTALEDIFEPAFLAAVDPGYPLRDLRDAYHRADAASSVNRMMHLDLKITLADNDLRKVNQACGLAGVDVRYPLLDEDMLAFAASVPPGMQVQRTRLRWFFKRALADFLPREILEKKKHGFGLPVGLWMAEFEPLRALADTSLASLRERGIIRPSYVDWLRDQHRGAHASYYGVMLWVLLMLEQWLQQHGQ